jgi:chromosome segregation ATPase
MIDTATWDHIAALVGGAAGGGALLKILQAILKARNARHTTDVGAGLKRAATDTEVGMLLRDELRSEIIRLREEVVSLKAQIEKLVELLSTRHASEAAIAAALAEVTAERNTLRIYTEQSDLTIKEYEAKVGELQADITRLSFQKQEPRP